MARGRRRNSDITLASTWNNFRSDYNAARDNRFRRKLSGVSAMGSGADYHIRNWSDNLRMMERARSYDRNDPIIGQGIGRVVENVLMDGIRLDPQFEDPETEAHIRDNLWLPWAKDPAQCDRAGEHDLDTIAELTLRSVIVDGDICHLPTKEGSLETIEAHRLRTPTNARGKKYNVVHGVKLDDFRKRLEYWFVKEDIGLNRSIKYIRDVRKYAARDSAGNRQVFHVYNPRRVSQTRGITTLAPIMDTAGMHEDIMFAKLVQSQIASCFAIIREFDDSSAGAQGDIEHGERTTVSRSDGSSMLTEGIGPGIEYTGEPGETITGFSPNIPNPEFFKHAMLTLCIIAVNLGIPVQVLLLDPKETNFSGWRGAIDQARAGFRHMRKWMIARFYDPTYYWKMRGWIQSDKKLIAVYADIGDAIFKHTWNWPGWPYIEPHKDIKSDAVQLDKHINSPRNIQASRGREWDRVALEIVEDRKLLIVTAIKATDGINKDFPDAKVDWREVAGFKSDSASDESSKSDRDDDEDKDENKKNDTDK